MQHSIARYEDKVLACWLGKNVGGILGTPTEGYPGTLDFTYYDPVPSVSMPNDDFELQVMNAVALAAMAMPEVNRDIIAEIWKQHLDFHCDEYAVALKNLKSGIRPPWSGSYDNYFRHGMGAAIRSELWACLAPGNPSLAAQFAYEDACVDHAGDGINAEVFLAAVESQAFISDDIVELIQCGIGFLPDNSLLGQCLRETCALWHEQKDWKSVRNRIQDKYASEFRTAVIPNVPFTVLALLAGGGDFSRTICTAVNCGMDTDCSGATAGAIMGIINPDGISEKWLAPIGHALVVRDTCIRHMKFPATIEVFSELVVDLEKRMAKTVRQVNHPEPDYKKFMISGEYSVIKNLPWYFVPTRDVKWTVFQCNPIYFALKLPAYEYGQQVLLRFHFELAEDGAYSVMFNSPTSNQVYLDPDYTLDSLHDAKHMLFGRMRTFEQRAVDRLFPASENPVIFAPVLSGAPLNQIKRNLLLKKGVHELLIALEPLSFEREIYWGLGVGDEDSRFISCFQANREAKS